MTIGPPNDNTKFVTKMNAGPLFFPNFSFAASLAEAELAGYSPPTPIPVNPRATVSIQNMPSGYEVGPEAVARMAPRTIVAVVPTMAVFLPTRSQICESAPGWCR